MMKKKKNSFGNCPRVSQLLPRLELIYLTEENHEYQIPSFISFLSFIGSIDEAGCKLGSKT